MTLAGTFDSNVTQNFWLAIETDPVDSKDYLQGTFQQNNTKLDFFKGRHRIQNLSMAGTKSVCGGLHREYKIKHLNFQHLPEYFLYLLKV